MYELYKSNEQEESLLLLEDNMSKTGAMKALKECEEEHCQVEYWNTPPTEYKNGDLIPIYSYTFPSNTVNYDRRIRLCNIPVWRVCRNLQFLGRSTKNMLP